MLGGLTDISFVGSMISSEQAIQKGVKMPNPRWLATIEVLFSHPYEKIMQVVYADRSR